MLSENDTVPPHFEAHRSYISIDTRGTCGYLFSLERNDRCEFVKETYECSQYDFNINYVVHLFCTFSSYILGVICIVLWLILLILIIHTLVVKCYFPVVIYMCKLLRLSEHFAAYSFLAIGNYLPNIISTMREEGKKVNTEMIFNEIMGAALVNATIVAATIMWRKQFYVVRSFFTIHLTYTVIIILTIWLSLSKTYMTIFEAVIIIVITLIFYIIFYTLHHVYKRQVKKYYIIRMGKTADEDIVANMQALVSPIKIFDNNGQPVPEEDVRTYNVAGDFEHWSALQQLFESLKPFTREKIDRAGFLRKLYYLIRAPIWVLLGLIIPTVDYRKPWHGWSKYLYLICLITYPLCIIFVTNTYNHYIGGVFPVYGAVILIMYAIVVLIYCLSAHNKKPAFHVVFAPYTFIITIGLIYILSTELISCLSAIGIILRANHPFLGLTIVPWAYTLLDLNINLNLAMAGYHTMAYLVCYTGPLTNIIISLVVTTIVEFVNDHTLTIRMRDGQNGQNCLIFYLLTICFTQFGMFLTNFQARKSFSIFLFMIYFIFLIYIFLIEFEVIHAYGTDHVEERLKFNYFGIG